MTRYRHNRINDQDLYRLLVEEGHSQREAADYFGVTEAAISRRVKNLNLNLTRHVGLERAKDVADHGLNVVEQLQGINRVIRDELEWARRRPVVLVGTGRASKASSLTYLVKSENSSVFNFRS